MQSFSAYLSQSRDTLQIQRVADIAMTEPERLTELVECLFDAHPDVPRRAAWALQRVQDAQIELLRPFQARFLEALGLPQHGGVTRCLMRYFAEAEPPKSMWPALLEIAFAYLEDPKEAIAIRVHSMELIYRISIHEPDLGRELELVLEAHYPNGSAGFKNRARKILKKLSAKGRR